MNPYNQNLMYIFFLIILSQISRKKAQMLLSEKEAELLKWKEMVHKMKRGGSKQFEKSAKTDTSLPVFPNKILPTISSGTTKTFSAASLTGDDKEKIVQLEQKIKELSEVINLQGYTEKALSKKVDFYESSKNNEDVNYEYIKNIFLKYLIFKEHGEEESKRLEQILLDILKVTPQEKESLTKGRSTKGIWGLFYKDTSKEEALASLSTSFVVPPQRKVSRAQTESTFDFRGKGGLNATVIEDFHKNENEDFADLPKIQHPVPLSKK